MNTIYEYNFVVNKNCRHISNILSSKSSDIHKTRSSELTHAYNAIIVLFKRLIKMNVSTITNIISIHKKPVYIVP